MKFLPQTAPLRYYNYDTPDMRYKQIHHVAKFSDDSLYDWTPVRTLAFLVHIWRQFFCTEFIIIVICS